MGYYTTYGYLSNGILYATETEAREAEESDDK